MLYPFFGEEGFLNPVLATAIALSPVTVVSNALRLRREIEERGGGVEQGVGETDAGHRRGYIKVKDEKIQNRLRRIEGQARDVQRMVDEEAYCVDVLTQLGSIVSASEKVTLLLLKDHTEHCARGAVEDGEGADEKIEEFMGAVERFLRVQGSGR
jgi:DNA-binding FrmR family transcriptional regulator